MFRKHKASRLGTTAIKSWLSLASFRLSSSSHRSCISCASSSLLWLVLMSLLLASSKLSKWGHSRLKSSKWVRLGSAFSQIYRINSWRNLKVLGLACPNAQRASKRRLFNKRRRRMQKLKYSCIWIRRARIWNLIDSSTSWWTSCRIASCSAKKSELLKWKRNLLRRHLNAQVVSQCNSQ